MRLPAHLSPRYDDSSKRRCRRCAVAGFAFGACLCLACASSFAQASSQNTDPGITTSVTGAVSQQRNPKNDTHAKENAKAEQAYIEGARLLERNDREAAERQFQLASSLAPDNRDYALAVTSIREGRVVELIHRAGKARIEGHALEAEALLAQARKIDPDNPLLAQHPNPNGPVKSSKVDSWIIDGPRLAGPIELKPAPGLKSFHIHSALPEALRQLAAAYGLKVVVDSTVPQQQVKFDLEDVTYAQAIHVLSQMGTVFTVPLTEDSFFVAVDNQESRNKYQHQVQETIYAAGMTNEQLAELGNMIRSVFEIKQVSVQNSFGTLVVRAPADTLQALNLTLRDLLEGNAEVMIDLKLYSVDKTSTRNIGVTLPSQAGAFSVASEARSLIASNQDLINQAIAQGLVPAGTSDLDIVLALIKAGLITSPLLSGLLATVGGGLSSTGIYSTTSSTLNFALNSSDTRALDEIQLRVGDRQSATFRAGSKYPITQSTYSTTSAATTSSLAGATVNGVSVASLLNAATTATTPQIQYEDLGLTLKATPTIQKSGLVSLHLDLKIESLAGGTNDNIPILTNSSLTSDITVADGTTAFLVSNMNKSQSAAVTGVPGLSDLPGFQSTPDLLRTTDVGELLMVITPHLVRKRSNDTAGPIIPINVPASSTSE
jgi:type II secretory pathway component GspD/PulD (secretin)